MHALVKHIIAGTLSLFRATDTNIYVNQYEKQVSIASILSLKLGLLHLANPIIARKG